MPATGGWPGRAGRGGRGNASFLTNRRRAPAFAEQGEKGHEQWYDLELALVADVALVGLPNVGKSTLISRISAAKPKIADYPFTTLEPHLGVVRAGDESDFTVADIPGLVEGAAEGKGLGHRFLRHITRARVLVVLVELDPVTGIAPAEQLRVLLDELGRYQPDLLDRPRVVVGSKADMVGSGSERPDGEAGDPLRPRPGHLGGHRPGDRRAGRAAHPAGRRGPRPSSPRRSGHRHPPARCPRGSPWSESGRASTGWWVGWPSGPWPSTT